MAEYIERNAVIKTINKYRIGLRVQGLVILDGAVAEVRKRIDSLPNADVRPVVRGEWIKIDKYDNESNVQCSACLEEFDYVDGVCYLCHGYELPLFCPNCGADMRGQKDG